MNNSDTTTPIIHKHIMLNAKLKDFKLRAPLHKKEMISAKVWQKSKEGNHIMNQMQKRLILLWSATTWKDLQILEPKQKIYLALWEHIVNCRDEACKRPHCQSSFRVLYHYKRCKLLNQRSTCKLCGPVMKCIRKNSSRNNYWTSKQHGKIQMEKTKQIASSPIYDSDKNQPLTTGLTSSSQTVTKFGERNAVPQKRRCTIVRWSKSVKGGPGADSVVQAIKTKNTKSACTQNMQHKKELLSDIGSIFAGKYILEEKERKEIVDTSIALLSLKKRVWGNITTNTNSTPEKAKIVSTSNTDKDYPKLLISPKIRRER